MSTEPETRYAKSGDIHVAYHLFGAGPTNLVLVPVRLAHPTTTGTVRW